MAKMQKKVAKSIIKKGPVRTAISMGKAKIKYLNSPEYKREKLKEGANSYLETTKRRRKLLTGK